MADVTKLVPHIVKWEGGWVNDPDDLGGATNKGVCFRTYKLYRQRKKLPAPTIEDLKNISDEEFADILKSMYWDACRADQIESQSVANAIVDWAWNSGTVTASKEVQKVLGVAADGIIGNITLAAINSRSPLPLFGAIQQARLDYLERICVARPANRKFENGWTRRVKSLQYVD
jgi:lysozyme family protein